MIEDKGVEDFFVRCRELGLRVTPQRMMVYRELSRTKEHPSAESVFDQVRKSMPTISLDTVYRTLSLLESRQLVWTVATVGRRARYDANMVPHYHFICRSCGSVSDLSGKLHEDFIVPKEVAELGRIDHVSVQLQGTCHVCLQAPGRQQQKRRKGSGKSRIDQ